MFCFHSLVLAAIGAQEFIIILGVLILGLIPTALWIWALVDILSNEPSTGNDKIIWILVIVLTGAIGAIIYLLVRRPKRITMLGR